MKPIVNQEEDTGGEHLKKEQEQKTEKKTKTGFSGDD